MSESINILKNLIQINTENPPGFTKEAIIWIENWANKRKITVITNEGAKKKKMRINYNKIISGKDPSQNIILKRDDTIVVP